MADLFTPGVEEGDQLKVLKITYSGGSGYLVVHGQDARVPSENFDVRLSTGQRFESCSRNRDMIFEVWQTA
jgi:hypothetical protein